MDTETERHVINAAKVNKTGPYCTLCEHFEMAERYATARGYRSLREALNDWIIARAKTLNDQDQP